MESIHNPNQAEAQSFEISQWFSNILNRIDNIQYHQKYLIKWRNLAIKLKKYKRIERFNYVQSKYRQKKCSNSSKANWLTFYSKLWHRKKKYIFNMAKNQLLDAKRRAEDLRRAKKILMIPETESEYEYDDNNDSNPNSNDNLNQMDLNRHQFDDLSPNNKKWISMVQRFVSQTKYTELHQAYENYLDDLNYQEQERRDTWREMAHTLVWNIEKNNMKKMHKKLKQARENWKDLYSNFVLTSKLNYIKKVYAKWNSLSIKTDSQVRRCWKRFYFSMRFKKNIIRMVRESSALSTLTNFFRYIILIKRSTAVAKYFPIRYIASIRSMVKKSTLESADKIKKFASMKVFHDNDAFADNWSNCIAEAFSSVASRQIGPPVSIEQRKKRTRSSANKHVAIPKKTSIDLNVNNPNSTIIQTIQNKIDPSHQNEQIPSENQIKIIKITRDFDPSEEESEKEVIRYLSDSSGGSDGGSGRFKDSKINGNKEKIIILTSPNEKSTNNGNVLIEVNPSGSQSTASMEESTNNENSDSTNINQNKIIQNQEKNNKPKLQIESTGCQELKPVKKKKQMPKELYAPIVIPKRKRHLSPIKKKRFTKRIDNVTDPSISDILGLVGIDSSLEILDEGSEVDNSNSSDIHFRFDDESSDPNDPPMKDLVVDLINIHTSDEERRIRQSLLEASQASSNPPNEDDDIKLPNLKEEKKIDLLSPSQTTNKESTNLTQHDISSSPSSYNSNSDFGKEKESPDDADEKKSENKSNAEENVVIEEEEEEIETPRINLSDEKTDLFKNIGKEEEEKAILKNEEEEKVILQSEEEDISCKFNFDSEKHDEKKSSNIKVNPSSLSEQKSLEGPSDSYISDRDVDAAMHEYSSENTTH